ncbi:MAG: hypothetical protein MUE79_04465 [Nitratireductor sp.]|jgi:hypothetical protein|nr:hypothetical protein [Nitratireductor sp.]
MTNRKFSVLGGHYVRDAAGSPRLLVHESRADDEPAQVWAVMAAASPYALLVFDRDHRGLARLVAEKLNEGRALDVIEACLALGAQYAPDVIERNGLVVTESRAEDLASAQPGHWDGQDSTLPCFIPHEGGAPWARCDFEAYVRERFGDCMSQAGAPSAGFARAVFDRCLATGASPQEVASELARTLLGCDVPAAADSPPLPI